MDLKRNPILERFKDRPEALDDIANLLIENELMSDEDRQVYQKAGQSYKYRSSMVAKTVQENLDKLEQERSYSHKELAWLVSVLKKEQRLLEMAFEPQMITRALEEEGLPCPENAKITPLFSKINYPFLIEGEEKGNESLFVRYSGLSGQYYLNRFSPRETVYQTLLCEKIINDLVREGFTTRTRFPTFTQASDNRGREEPKDIVKTLLGRIIVQKNHTPEYHQLLEHPDFEEAGRIYGAVVAELHASSFGQNKKPTGEVAAYFSEIRDKTAEEYEKWMRKYNWIGGRYEKLKRNIKGERSARSDALESVRGELDGLWDRCVDEGVRFWKEGAIVSTPDMSPRNTFVNERGETKIYDLDNLAFYDPSYHLGKTLNILLRSGTERDIWDEETLLNSVREFLASYHNGLNTAGSKIPHEDPKFLKTAGGFAALDYISYYLMSAEALKMGEDKINTVMNIGRKVLKGEV